jgi:two-component system OmpR family response regulator/two-component system response regulator QseB
MPPPSRLLLAEDDPVLGAALATALRRDAWEVDWVQDGLAAYAAVQKQPPDALLLDLGLPGMPGLDLLHRVRQSAPEMPVLIVTAQGYLPDRVRGLDMGADDYIAKPFEVEELMARLRAVTRRAHAGQEAVLQAGDIRLDLRSHRVRRGGEEIWLTGREFAVLKLLMQHAGRPVPRAQIEQHLYGWGEVVEANTVDVFVHHLRRKLGRDAIHTYRGMGYTMSR